MVVLAARSNLSVAVAPQAEDPSARAESDYFHDDDDEPPFVPARQVEGGETPRMMQSVASSSCPTPDSKVIAKAQDWRRLMAAPTIQPSRGHFAWMVDTARKGARLM